MPTPGYSAPGGVLSVAEIAGIHASAPSVPGALNAFLTADDLTAVPASGLTADEVAGIQGATTPITAANPVVSVADLPVDPGFPGDGLTADEVAGIQGATTPATGANPIVTVADLPADPSFAADALTADEVAGIQGATSPATAANPVVTVGDLPAAYSPPVDDWTSGWDDKFGSGAGRTSAVAAGWAVSGAGTHSNEVSYHKIVGNATGRFISRALPAGVIADAGWEVRVEALLNGVAGDATAATLLLLELDGVQGIYLRVNDTGDALEYLDSGTTWTQLAAPVRGFGTRHATLTVRNLAEIGSVEFYLGPVLLGRVPRAGLAADLNITAGNIIALGMSAGIADAYEIQLARCAIRSGVNTVPVADGWLRGGWA